MSTYLAKMIEERERAYYMRLAYKQRLETPGLWQRFVGWFWGR